MHTKEAPAPDSSATERSSLKEGFKLLHKFPATLCTATLLLCMSEKLPIQPEAEAPKSRGLKMRLAAITV